MGVVVSICVGLVAPLTVLPTIPLLYPNLAYIICVHHRLPPWCQGPTLPGHHLPLHGHNDMVINAEGQGYRVMLFAEAIRGREELMPLPELARHCPSYGYRSRQITRKEGGECCDWYTCRPGMR